MIKILRTAKHGMPEQLLILIPNPGKVWQAINETWIKKRRKGQLLSAEPVYNKEDNDIPIITEYAETPIYKHCNTR